MSTRISRERLEENPSPCKTRSSNLIDQLAPPLCLMLIIFPMKVVMMKVMSTITNITESAHCAISIAPWEEREVFLLAHQEAIAEAQAPKISIEKPHLSEDTREETLRFPRLDSYLVEVLKAHLILISLKVVCHHLLWETKGNWALLWICRTQSLKWKSILEWNSKINKDKNPLLLSLRVDSLEKLKIYSSERIHLNFYVDILIL